MFSFGLLSDNKHAAGSRPFITSGTCKREDAEAHAQLISLVIDACEAESETIGCPLFCVASDGESRRGSAFTTLTQKHTLSQGSELFALVGGMRLMNMLVGDNNITADKDPKHIMKRCRNLVLRKSGVMISGTLITPVLLRFHLKEAGLNSIRIDNLLNPTDRQNVPVCFTLLKEIWTLEDPKPTDKPTFVKARNALQVLGTLFRHLVLPFVQVTLSLHEQLVHLSAAAHLANFLFTINDAWTAALPALTYKDIILMVKNAYFCVAKAKITNPDGSFWLILLGTDRLEASFGIVRSMVGTDANADMSSLTTSLSHSVECLNIFSKHPEWDRGPRRLKLPAIEDGNGDIISAVDHINPISWKGDVRLRLVTPITVWNEGRRMVKNKFSSLGLAKHFAELEKKGFDLLFPFGNQNDSDTDLEESESAGDSYAGDSYPSNQSTPHFDINAAHLEESESSDPLTLEDHIDIETTRNGKGKYDPFVDVGNGKMVSKA